MQSNELTADPTITSTIKFSNPVIQCTDIEKLQSTVLFLWGLLDEIDSTSDIAKLNDSWYRKRVEHLQRQRHQVAKSDGYDLYFHCEL